MRAFPFLSLHTTLILLRIAGALIFITHAVVRVANGTVERFGSFLESKGLPLGIATVWCLSAFEIVGGVLLALGYYKKWLSAGFILILLVGIILIHASIGWFVGEHGSGGSEYSFILIVALLVIAAGDEKGKTK
ncbi:DoxX family protein [Chryseotalea sanaruensis]|uniref:DoxX family protein n=1 Tax=Chryseotalea sanaruensis TaxID=2482724 RepID=A0A401UFM7_9BACT|nr:DoxX family protein [Chryseotalea sanaruensis]GCC53672.1 DoxX family protein [Chryseotalea sanaruensis]